MRRNWFVIFVLSFSIASCLKAIPSRSSTSIRQLALQILKLLIQSQHQSIYEKVDEVLSQLSKFSKLSNVPNLI